jgi:hypothetical protein
MSSGRPSPARSFANLILFIGFVSAGIATFMSLSGNAQTGLYVCLGGAGLAVVVLLFGGLVVGANREDAE